MSVLRRFSFISRMAKFGCGFRPPAPLLQYLRPQFCPVRLSTARPPLRVNPGCDLVYESANAEPINQPAETHQEASNETKNPILTPRLPGKHMSITFTCNVCKTRTQKFFSKLAYTRGLVIIRCPSCQSLHLIADNLGWIKEKTPWRIGEQTHLLVSESKESEIERK